ncbi:MAG: histidine phosphatase family protein [Tepidiformaceae bacterium]
MGFRTTGRLRVGRGVILVRHAMPQMRPGVASGFWTLGESAKEDCVLLAHALPKGIAPVIWSSPEPKAAETASIVALRRGFRVVTDARLSEVDRPATWEDDYRATVKRYLTNGGEPGWEPPEAVQARCTAAVDDALNRPWEGEVVISSHGIALSLYAASVATVRLPQFWDQLTFPDAWRVEMGERSIERIYFGGLPPA